MDVCEKTGQHVGYQKQLDLEHFTLVIARCQRCDKFLDCKAFQKEVSPEKS